MLLLKGEVWIVDGRKGRLTVKLLEDVDPAHNMFFAAELISGTPWYMSNSANPEEPGDEMSFRATLTRFVEKVET